MNAYRNYNTNTSALSKNLEKLSSGYKINRAGDDAAGLAISEKMRAQITGLNAASKNVKDGISLVKTAEGAMQEIQDMLNRMDYLATQSANGTYDDEVDRKNLQAEVDQLKSEINRIADSANFNGIKLLDGSQAGQEAVAEKTEVLTVKGSHITGMDRIITTTAGDTDKTYEVAGQKTVLDTVGAKPTTAKFYVNFNDLKVSSYGTAAGSIKAMTVTIGTITANIASIAVGSKNSISSSTIAQSIASKVKTAIGTTVTLNGVKWKVTASAGKVTFEQKVVASTDAKATANFDVKISGVTYGSGTSASVSIDGTSLGNLVKVERQGISINAAREANTVFEIKGTDLQDGTVIRVGDKSITLKVGAQGKATQGSTDALVDLSEMEEGQITGDKLSIALGKISVALGSRVTDSSAKDLAGATVSGVQLSVGVNRKEVNGMVSLGIGVHRVDGGSKAVYTDLDKLGAVFEIVTPEHTVTKYTPGVAADTGGLTLQIGDTAESYNQMRVIIGDMHTDAMGAGKDAEGNESTDTIKDISVAKREDAQKAVQTIRNAINYVSSVRGTLGATQNRLEHTANNLSVMTENIQDAESTIRDTDIAEEMMSYTKNNILVQSAQAMLAQANAVPQGVLQLLG